MRFAAAAIVVLGACGRIGFEASGDAGGSGPRDALADSDGASMLGAIHHVAVLAARDPGMGFSDSFSIQAAHAGDLVVLFTGCQAATTAMLSSVIVSGWNVMPVPGATGGASTVNIATYYAIAPNTNAAIASVAWNVVSCTDLVTFADELTSDTGQIAIDSGTTGIATGRCDVSTVVRHAGSTIWAGCHSTTDISAVSNGWSKGGDDGQGDWTAWKLTAQPVNGAEPTAFTMPVGLAGVAAAEIYAP